MRGVASVEFQVFSVDPDRDNARVKAKRHGVSGHGTQRHRCCRDKRCTGWSPVALRRLLARCGYVFSDSRRPACFSGMGKDESACEYKTRRPRGRKDLETRQHARAVGLSSNSKSPQVVCRQLGRATSSSMSSHRRSKISSRMSSGSLIVSSSAVASDDFRLAVGAGWRFEVKRCPRGTLLKVSAELLPHFFFWRCQ